MSRWMNNCENGGPHTLGENGIAKARRSTKGAAAVFGESSRRNSHSGFPLTLDKKTKKSPAVRRVLSATGKKKLSPSSRSSPHIKLSVSRRRVTSRTENGASLSPRPLLQRFARPHHRAHQAARATPHTTAPLLPSTAVAAGVVTAAATTATVSSPCTPVTSISVAAPSAVQRAGMPNATLVVLRFCDTATGQRMECVKSLRQIQALYRALKHQVSGATALPRPVSAAALNKTRPTCKGSRLAMLRHTPLNPNPNSNTNTNANANVVAGDEVATITAFLQAAVQVAWPVAMVRQFFGQL